MKLASIEKVVGIKPHPNADRLELATILGWQAVVKKGEFREGDTVVYIHTDSIVPKTPWSEFLASKSRPDAPIRIRSIKLRGEYSSGLVLPLTVLEGQAADWQEGADVGNILGVKKYEKEVPAQLIGVSKGGFPLHIAPRTDEDNGLSNPKLAEFVLRSPCSVTMKLDGSSMTVIIENGQITNVCSRNIDLKDTEENAFWKVARKMTIPEDFSGVIQGELMGPGIQGNQLELLEPRCYVFQIKHNGEWLRHGAMENVAEMLGLHSVPQILNTHYEKNYERPEDGLSFTTVAELQDFADSLTLERIVERSKYTSDPLVNVKRADGTYPWAEGIVVRPCTPSTSGSGRPLSFKLINRNYGE